MIALLILGITAFALVIGAFVAMWIREEQRYRVYERDIQKDIVAEKEHRGFSINRRKKARASCRSTHIKGVTHDHNTQARSGLRITDTGAQERNRLTRWQNRA